MGRRREGRGGGRLVDGLGQRAGAAGEVVIAAVAGGDRMGAGGQRRGSHRRGPGGVQRRGADRRAAVGERDRPGPGGFGLTVAVKVTGCPTTDGLAEEVTAVAVAVAVTGTV